MKKTINFEALKSLHIPNAYDMDVLELTELGNIALDNPAVLMDVIYDAYKLGFERGKKKILNDKRRSRKAS